MWKAASIITATKLQIGFIFKGELMNKTNNVPSFCAGFIIIPSIPVWVAVASKKTATVAWREARPPSIQKRLHINSMPGV